MTGSSNGEHSPPDLIPRVLAFLQAADIENAAALARNALEHSTRHALLFHVRAQWLERKGQAEAALADLEQAKALAPADPGIQSSIGQCLLALGRWNDAVAACNAAIALDPQFALAHYNKGYGAESLGDLNLARRCYEQAARLDPQMAQAHARLAALATRRSDWGEARRLAEKALALDPQTSIATFALVRTGLAERVVDGLEARLQRVMDDASSHPEERATALNLLGDILDRQDRTAEAFAAYQAANSELMRAFAARYETIETGRQIVSRLTRHFENSPAWPPGANPAPASDDRSAGHVFLLGFYRAGTTLLGQVLASHPDVVTFDERPVLDDAIRDFVDEPSGMQRLAALGTGDIDRYRQIYWKRVRDLGLHTRGKIVVDKLPLNTIYLPLIAKLFPQAKVLFALRDPRDVVFSCFRRLLNVNRNTIELLSLDRGAQFYSAVMRLAQIYRARLPLDLLEVRNEDLVADFDGQVLAICRFLRIERKAAMNRFSELSKTRAIATPSAAQIARGLNGDGIGQWRRYALELSPILPLLRPWAEAFGYPAE